MTDAASIARHAAARLTATLGPDLPAQVEQELDADPLDPPKRLADPVSLAALLVSVASLAWTIWHDLKKDHASPQSEQAEALAAALTPSAPPALAPPQRTVLVRVVAEETVRIVG